MVKLDIQSTECILLLGAGFTKNFGGLLADEMWAEIFNHKEIQAQPKIKTLMLNNFNYEEVYHSVLWKYRDEDGILVHSEFTEDEKDAIKVATKSAYKHIDDILRTYVINHPYPSELNCVTNLIHKIGSQSVIYNEFYHEGLLYHSFTDIKEKSFIFTLNQDLFFERLYSKNYTRLSIPGVDNNSEWFTTYFNKPLDESDCCKLPHKEKLNSEDILSNGNFYLIKLHGSCNWKSHDGSDIMVLGRGKVGQIKQEPLLDHYFKIFDTVLSQGRRKLLIVGYSFSDEHINEIISKAIMDHELKIYILSPGSPNKLRETLYKVSEKSEGKINIWNGISGYFQNPKDILLGTDLGLVKKEHLCNTFFGT